MLRESGLTSAAWHHAPMDGSSAAARAVPFDLRPATRNDVDAVLAFWKSSAEDTGRNDDHVAVERLLERDPQALLLAVDDSGIIGSVIAGWDGWRCHLYRVAVREDWRRRGVARALIAHAEHRFADVGSRRVDAMVLQDNSLGRSAWKALGYTPQHEWRRWVKRI